MKSSEMLKNELVKAVVVSRKYYPGRPEAGKIFYSDREY